MGMHRASGKTQTRQDPPLALPNSNPKTHVGVRTHTKHANKKTVGMHKVKEKHRHVETHYWLLPNSDRTNPQYVCTESITNIVGLSVNGKGTQARRTIDSCKVVPPMHSALKHGFLKIRGL